jgi:GGDEF domain-containing protein
VHTPGSGNVADGFRALVPAAQFEEMLGRAIAATAMAAAAAPERTPPSPSPSPSTSYPIAVFYVDVDRRDLAAAGLTEAAIEHVLAEVGRRLVSWAGRAGAVTRRGGDHFVLLCRPGLPANCAAGAMDDRGAFAFEFDGDACERALADLRRHFHRPMLIAGRRLSASGRVDVVDVARATGASSEPSSIETH